MNQDGYALTVLAQHLMAMAQRESIGYYDANKLKEAAAVIAEAKARNRLNKQEALSCRIGIS